MRLHVATTSIIMKRRYNLGRSKGGFIIVTQTKPIWEPLSDPTSNIKFKKTIKQILAREPTLLLNATPRAKAGAEFRPV